VLPGAAQRDEEVEVDEQRRIEYELRREAATAAGHAELARALDAKIAELRARVQALRATPLPEPPPDRPSLRISFIPITEALPEDPAVRRILTRYYGAVARMNLAAAAKRPCPPPAKAEASYIGLDDAPPGGTVACKVCHAGAFDQWKGTRHAGAYATLARAERQFDLDCITCHVTGWKAPGGPCNVAATEGRRDVQCEACHGPASLHAVDPPGHIDRSPTAEKCRTCHTPEHSTHFEPESYFKKITGVGHGGGSSTERSAPPGR
jgi:hypothetical protein